MNADLRVGVITRTHGIRGEVKVYPTTDSPLRFRDLEGVLLKLGKRMRALTVDEVSFFKNLVIVKFREINTLEEAEVLKGGEIYIDREDGEPLAENEYYIADLLGMEVYDADNKTLLGTLKDVLQTGANDVYIVAREGQKDLLLPAIRDCIRQIDVENNRMEVHVMPGLLDL
ncbi:MAG: ribosome maturation factor RimM [Eubacteriales bacterium]|nr:ribosome maturation factor RimM [Eubacteriales bacterium]